MGATINRMVFQPPVTTYETSPELIWLDTEKQNQIPAIYFDRGAQLTILFSHGNAEDLGMVNTYLRHMTSVWNTNIFAYEYSGYGLSTGKPMEKNVYADADAAYKYLTQDLNIAPGDIVLYGRSLGSGAACHLASTNQTVGGLLLQSPFTSIHRIVFDWRFTLPVDMFCNIDKISRVKCPVFIIHGTEDEVVPVSHGKDLYNAAKFRTTAYWVTGAGHNNLEATAGVEIFERISGFLRLIENGVKNDEYKRQEFSTV